MTKRLYSPPNSHLCRHLAGRAASSTGRAMPPLRTMGATMMHDKSNDNLCLQAALAYASKNPPLHVFPAKPGEKKSRLSKQYAADGKNWGMSNNPDTIKKNWQKFPNEDSNVCIVTGDINGLFVVETDSAAHGKDGEAELKKLIAVNGGEWPETLTARSPSGSVHSYFTWPDGDYTITNSDSKLAPGVDVRGNFGMVVAPPSYVPKYDDRYQWISAPDVGIKAAPQWLVDLVASKPIERKVGDPQADIEKIKEAMKLIPNDKPEMSWEVTDYKTGEVNTRAGWEGWNTIMMALWLATAGSPEGYAIALEWCAKNKTKFNEKYTHHTWHRRYRQSPPKSVGAGTLFTIAETEKPGWQKMWDHDHMDEIVEAKVEEAIRTEKYIIKRDKSTDKNIRELEEYLIANKVPLYVYGGALVRPIISSIKATQDRRTKTAALHDVTAQWLKVKALEHIVFMKWDARAKKWIPCGPDMELFNDLMAKKGDWKFPVIDGIISTPTLRRDGEIFSAPGYDEATRLLMIEPPPLPKMPAKSSKADALQAVELLEDDLLSEFVFVDDVASSVALSAIITPVAKGACNRVPMFVNKAPSGANGKSYLFDIVAAIAIGQLMPVIAAGRTEEETEKRLSGVLLKARPLINIDNVNGELGGEGLDQFLERPTVEIRVLGKNDDNRTIDPSCTCFFTNGINITLVGTTTRRAVTCGLDRNEERPELFDYKKNPVDMVLNDRGKYIAACLTICRAYLQAGSPNKATPRLGSYELWSDTVRSALIWLGRADPVKSMDAAHADDPKRIEHETILTEWKKAIGTGEVNAMYLNKVMELAQENGDYSFDKYVKKYPEFHDAICQGQVGFHGKPDQERFNKWAISVKGKLVGGMKLVNKKGHGGLRRWWVQHGDDPNKAEPGLRHADVPVGRGPGPGLGDDNPAKPAN
jgi:Bifunctional DNA primase/polymerase, N-terminal/Primase C terminal 2 (PriCT-2)